MPRTTTGPRYLQRNNANGVAYAYTRVDGRTVSLGRFGTTESRDRFERIRAEWAAAREAQDQAAPSRLTVAELAEKYLDHEAQRAAEGRVTEKTYRAAGYAVDALIGSHAGLPANRFGPRALKEIQSRLAKTPCRTHGGRYRGDRTPPTLSRTEANRRVNGIRRVFRWAVSEELVPASVLTSLEAVNGLRAGEARDNAPRTAASPKAVEATAHALEEDGHVGLANVIRLLRWTGCRPDEVCRLSVHDLVETPEGLELRLRDHKTRHVTNADRVVPLNARAEAIVQEALGAALQLGPDHRLFRALDGRPITPNALFQAIRRTTEAMGVAHWTPYQLRHLAATEMLDAGCSEAETAAMLGHSPDSTVVRRYSRDRTRLARRAANAIGVREAS